MHIVQLDAQSFENKYAFTLFSECIKGHDILNVRLTLPEFIKKFYVDDGNINTFNFINEEHTGFISSCVDKSQKKNFITFLTVQKTARNKGVATALLNAAEESLKKQGVSENFEISFYNPVTFNWNIPRAFGVTHPNFPGIDVAGSAYLFFKNQGYRDFSMQNSYYLDLKNYELPLEISKKDVDLKEAGYTFEHYNPKIHKGMKEFIESLNNPMWVHDILGEPLPENGGRPIIVPVFKNTVCGFTGPIDVEKSGRGYFAGIAISEQHRGKGLAKVLFSHLCVELKNINAGYMTLFTGENNCARNIYEHAGFKIVKTWADMRKQLEE